MYICVDEVVVSKNVRFLRNRRRMSRAKFSQYIGISYSQLYCIEHGLANCIEWKGVNNLSEIYGIPVEEILSEDLEEKYKEKRFHYNR